MHMDIGFKVLGFEFRVQGLWFEKMPKPSLSGRQGPSGFSGVYQVLSKLLVFPSISPIPLPYIIPYGV